MRYATPVSGPTSRASSPGVGVPRMGAIGEHGPLLGEETPRRVRARTGHNTGGDGSVWMEGDLPHIRYAINHLTREEEDDDDDDEVGDVGGRENHPDGFVWDEERGCFTRLGTSSAPSQQQQQQEQQQEQERETSPARSVQSSTSSMTTLGQKTFVAMDPPENSFLYPPLDYVPIVLRPWALALLIICCLLMIAGVSFCNVWSKKRQGLWDYDGQSGSRYFVFQFLPQILAAILILWIFMVQAAVYRVMPFAIMASERKLERVLQKLPMLSRNFLLPDLSHFLYGEPLVGFSLFTIWLANVFAIPLLSCLFQVKWYSYVDGANGQGRFRWTSVQPIGWTIVSLYGLLTIGLTILLVRFVRAWSGLMWDPTSIADLIPIIQRSNILQDFDGLETSPNVGKSLQPRALRLGYWKLSGKKDILFYGIGEEDAPVRTPSLHTDKQANITDVERQQNNLNMYEPATRYRWAPWFLRTISIIAWSVLVGGLFIAFIIASFLHDAIASGFPPHLPTLPSTDGFSSSNFVYSFIPSLIGTIFFLAYQHIDVYFRAVQPYASLSSSPTGVPAKHSLLLSYPSDLPLFVTIKALLNKHPRLALITLTSTVTVAIPILAGGIFTALYYPSSRTIRMTTLMPAFYALIAFCALYTVSLLAIWPRRIRYLPHGIATLGEQISFQYQSPLLADSGLRDVKYKEDLARMVVSGDQEVGGVDGNGLGETRYGFGVFVGRDGREHLGIERVRRAGREDMVILR